MSHKIEENKAALLERVIEKVREKMSAERALLCAEFIRQFFGTVAWDDLSTWSVEDLYGSAVQLWNFIEHRDTHEIKCRIYNPNFEEHGWQTTHTVVEVMCDDMSFLVDSLRMVINRMGMALHLIIHMGSIRLVRDAAHEITAILPRNSEAVPNMIIEAPVLMEIDRQTDPAVLDELARQFNIVLKETRAAVEDWQPMREQVRAIIQELDHLPETLEREEVEETKAFLKWVENHHFTFLGIRDYELVRKGDKRLLQAIPGTGLGVLRDELSQASALNISLMTPEARDLTLSSRILVVSKTNTLACVHRDAYTDYIGVKRFNLAGEVIGERRLLGLYTSAAYNTNPKDIPFLRHKVALIFKNSSLNPRSHAGRVLMNILETLPRDDLIQASEEELLDISMGIFHMQERRRIRMFARVDVYHRFVSCLVYVPRDRFNTDLLRAMQDILRERFNATSISFSTFFSESILARIHFMIRIQPDLPIDYDFKAIEQELIEVGRSWADELQLLMFEAFGEEKANSLHCRYKNAFPAVYTSTFSPRTALVDIKHIEQLSEKHPLGMNFYHPLDEVAGHYRLKIYQHDHTIPLSDVLPIIEKLGLRAISERPYELKFEDGRVTWVNEFTMHYTKACTFELDDIKDLFQNAFSHVWFGDAENDGFNQLVMASGLNWRQVSILRMYAKYFKQIGFTFSQDYIETALNHHPLIAKKIVKLFEIKFDPMYAAEREAPYAALSEELATDLNAVDNLDEDKIIRYFMQVIGVTLRTNYYQKNAENTYKSYISIKLNSRGIPSLPKPHPLFEIFVYSPQFEAVHLRGSKVARGGIRWSDRREDFRTEILGLMKAQHVKNAVIVPGGAKGGFVVKRAMSQTASREEVLAEGIRCYQQFIAGLLDITDNYVNAAVSKPLSVVCYDEDDPYLVVAADKGTATFSDIANAISESYGYWLGDAFASGGSAGYDHKKMGITARGAWESVKRHFYELNIDMKTRDFTVVGIGDMAGDVFGNGMLLSNHIQLLAAFNHQHIFIDPTPNAAVSFKERERMFKLPRSTWADYDAKCISTGGGVFNRNAKSIVVSQAMKEVFGIKLDSIEPNQLIKVLLKAKVDLLWSGGIGTFVKAQSENNHEVGDRSNDSIRINAKQLRCKSVVEGGNLGFTQLGRVEYALKGGLIYTDFIDNSGGVSCSDKEVNIKILLNSIVTAGDLTLKQRNTLLSAMTEEVSHLVLRENYLQTRAIRLTTTQAPRMIELHCRYMNELVKDGKLDRAIEFLPTEKELMERKLVGIGLTSPEISVLFCYSKLLLKEEMLASDVPEDPYLESYLVSSFPKPLQAKYALQMHKHPLKREIIATKISNLIVNEMGFGLVYRLQDEMGASIASIIKAYMIARSLLNMDEMWVKIEALDHIIDAKMQTQIMMIYVRLLRRLARWFLRNQRTRLDITTAVERYAADVQELNHILPESLGEGFHEQYNEHYEAFREHGIPDQVALTLTSTRGLFAAMDVVEIAQKGEITVREAAIAYFAVGEFLDTGWLRNQIIVHPTENHWESLAREAVRDDLDWQQRQLTASILKSHYNQSNFKHSLELWAADHTPLIERWKEVLSNLRSSNVLTYTMFFVAIRELLDLTQTTIQMTQGG